MSRYASGDDDAFGEVYDALAHCLFGYAMHQTHDRARTEDLVQQTFLNMHRMRGHFIPGAEVRPWAFAILRHLIIDGIRRMRNEVIDARDGADRGREPASRDAPADDVMQARELAVRVGAALMRLPGSWREAFELIRIENLSLEEAAEVVAATPNAVKIRLHRACESLRRTLGEGVDLGSDRGDAPA